MFDEEPEGDPHGECAAEIHRLQIESEALFKDAERWRGLRDRCVWMTFLSPDLVRVSFRVPVQWTRVIETGGDLDGLADAALAGWAGC